MTETEHEHLLRVAKEALDPSPADRGRVLQALDQRLADLSLGSQASSAGGAHSGASTWLGGAGAKAGVAVLLLATGSWLAFSPAKTPAPSRAPAQVATPLAAEPAVAATPSVAPQQAQPSAVQQAEAKPVEPSLQVRHASERSRLAGSSKRAAPSRSRALLEGRKSGPHARADEHPSVAGTAHASPPATAPSAQPSAVQSASAQPPEQPKVAPPASADYLAEELSLIQAASRALARKQPAQALEQLRRHEALYGSGGLAQEREGLIAIATCALGQTQTARRLGTSFLQRYPRSALAERVRSAVACE